MRNKRLARCAALAVALIFGPVAAQGADLSSCEAGLAAHGEGNFTKAIELYTGCIANGNLSGHDLALAYNNRGVSYAAEGDFVQALKDFDSTVRVEPDYAPVYRNRGFAYRSLGRYQLAFQNFDRAIELDPQAAAYNDRGNTHKDLGQYQNAIRDYDQAIKLDPDYAYAYFNRCWTMAKHLGRYEEALPDCERASRGLKDRAYAAYGLGFVYEHQGALAEARAAYERALEIDPDYAPAVADLARLKALSVN